MSTNSYNNELILNVDDSDGARYAKTRTLTRAGFKVIEAASGGEALVKARNEYPNLILLDVKLPDINGMEVCRQLKEDPATKNILVLQTSASFLGSADKIRSLDGGADNYLVEPIDPDELIANVKALLRLGKVERQLRDVDRRKDEFLATLAHELRNPLAPIRTSVELLKKLDPVVGKMQENARNTIQRHTDHLACLVDDLLDVSRISHGKITLRSDPVELTTFINSAIETSMHAILERAHNLTVNIPSEAIWIRGDRVRLSQIVSNVLLNAAKFTNPGGKLDLSAVVVDGKIDIRLTDNGIGISENSIDSIFELFSQSGHASDRRHEGLGIGLSLARALVKLHDGEIQLSSAGVGQGSTCRILLPIDSSHHHGVSAEQKASSNFSKRVLIVDDNEDAAVTLGQLLEISGNDVAIVFTGEEAIEKFLQFKPDVVLLDIGLPDITGYVVAKRIRELATTHQFTLIALTGYGQANDRQLAIEAGFDDHLVKPVDFKLLAFLGLKTESFF